MIGKFGTPILGHISEKYFYEIQTLNIQTPHRKLEVGGLLLGKGLFENEENDWGKGLGTFWNSIFERSEGMNGVWMARNGNPFFQK